MCSFYIRHHNSLIEIQGKTRKFNVIIKFLLNCEQSTSWVNYLRRIRESYDIKTLR